MSIAIQLAYNTDGPKCIDHPLEDTAYVCPDPSCPEHTRLILYCTMCLMESRVHKNHGPHLPKKQVDEEVLALYTALKN